MFDLTDTFEFDLDLVDMLDAESGIFGKRPPFCNDGDKDNCSYLQLVTKRLPLFSTEVTIINVSNSALASMAKIVLPLLCLF